MCEAKERNELLIHLYDQLWNSINVRISGLWQCTGVLVGALAVFALAEKQIIPVDIATSVIVFLSGWFLSSLQDASYWYNRNLWIISNIERQFLTKDDVRDVHCYMAERREKNSMIMHLKIQYVLGIGIAIVFLVYHFFTRIQPGLFAPWANFEPIRGIPYISCFAVCIWLCWLKCDHRKKYNEFIKKCPGKNIET